MLVLLPIVIECTSPRTTALNHTVQLSPIRTSPTITALSAKKQFAPNSGVNPRTDLIMAGMRSKFVLTRCHNNALKFVFLRPYQE